MLRRTDSPYWARTTTVADDGYAGLTVIPRWAANVYYNCYLAACTVAEWAAASGTPKTYADLIEDAKITNVRHLLGLFGDLFMFHQANMRVSGQPTVTVGTQTGAFSLIQQWVEAVAQELVRLTDWPVVNLKHDDIAVEFVRRRTRE